MVIKPGQWPSTIPLKHKSKGSKREEFESDEDTNTQADTNQQKETKPPLRIVRKNHLENQISDI